MPTGIYKRIKPAWNKGKKLDEKHKKNLSKSWNYNKHITDKLKDSAKNNIYKLHTPEIAKKISLALKGKPSHKQTPETKQKIREAMMEKVNNGTHNFFHMTFCRYTLVLMACRCCYVPFLFTI